jgi:hypothetical protein
MRKLFTISAMLLITLIAAGDAMTQQTSQPQTSNLPTLTIQNTCSIGTVSPSQFTWFDGDNAVLFQLSIQPPIQPGESRELVFEGNSDANITSVQVQGVITVGNRPTNFDLTVQANSTAQAECVSLSLRVGNGQTTNPGGETPQGQATLPNELQGFESLSPDQALLALQSRGFDTTVQGSSANPKLGDVSDPLLIGALSSGFTATGVWVSAPGQLRASALYDQPNANLVLLVFGGGFCASLSPTFVGLSGLSVNCDRPAIMEPFTTIGGGPVPGFVFLVLIVKIGGPAMPYVLSLSS